MPSTNTELARAWRARHKAKGLVCVHLWLNPTEKHQLEIEAAVHKEDYGRVVARFLRMAQNTRQTSDNVPSTDQPTNPDTYIPWFDPTESKLAIKLCKNNHEWGTSGRTLVRLSDGACRECEKKASRERRERKKAAHI